MPRPRNLHARRIGSRRKYGLDSSGQYGARHYNKYARQRVTVVGDRGCYARYSRCPWSGRLEDFDAHQCRTRKVTR